MKPRARRRVVTKPDQNGDWWVVTVPGDQPLAGPYEKRTGAVYVKNAIQEVLDREVTRKSAT